MSTADDNPIANDTIINMITNLKPRLAAEYGCSFSNTNHSESATSKRSLGGGDERTPAKRPRLDADYGASPREVRRLKVDLSEARNKIMVLENRIKQMHSVRKELQQVFESETADLRQQREFDRESIQRVRGLRLFGNVFVVYLVVVYSQLEAELESIRSREAKTKEKLSDLMHKHEMLKLEHSKHINELEKQLEETKEKSCLEEEKEKNENVTLKRKVEQLEMVLEAAQQDADAHKKLAEELSEFWSSDVLYHCFVLFVYFRKATVRESRPRKRPRSQEARAAQGSASNQRPRICQGELPRV